MNCPVFLLCLVIAPPAFGGVASVAGRSLPCGGTLAPHCVRCSAGEQAHTKLLMQMEHEIASGGGAPPSQ
jgi:hypothetical protein